MSKKNDSKKVDFEVNDEPKVKTFVVAKGKAVTCIKGTVNEGGKLEAKDFKHGMKDIEAHIAAGGVEVK
jgi:hypothetical protein